MKKLAIILVLITLFSVGIYAASADVYGSTLVGWWNMDNNQISGTSLTDLSGNGSTGTLTNSPTTGGAGRSGQSISFDGTNDHIAMGAPSALNLTGAMSISAWIYPRTFGGSLRGRIVDKDTSVTNGYIFYVNNSAVVNGLAFAVNGTFISGPVETVIVANAITLNKWQHVVATLDSSRLATLYKNGVLIGTTTIVSLPNSSADNFAIGGRTSDNARNFDGLIDDVRVYNTNLSASDVMTLYYQGLGFHASDY